MGGGEGKKLAVRTDRMTIATERSPGAVPAKILAVEYLGTIVNVTVQTAEAGELTVSVGDTAYFQKPVEIGQSVFLTWKTEDAHQLAA